MMGLKKSSVLLGLVVLFVAALLAISSVAQDQPSGEEVVRESKVYCGRYGCCGWGYGGCRRCCRNAAEAQAIEVVQDPYEEDKQHGGRGWGGGGSHGRGWGGGGGGHGRGWGGGGGRGRGGGGGGGQQDGDQTVNELEDSSPLAEEKQGGGGKSKGQSGGRGGGSGGKSKGRGGGQGGGRGGGGGGGGGV
ncbi:hypothetical protein LINPERHAP1_LOCUS7753 [Linum perenne]